MEGDEGKNPGNPGDSEGNPVNVLKKKILLVRHAESIENVRIRAAKSTWTRMRSFMLPKLSEIGSTLMLLKFENDANLSDNGKEMALAMQDVITKNGLFETLKPELIIYSPLIRAKKTFQLMIQPLLPQVESQCLDILAEQSISEHVYSQANFRERVSRFESWLDEREEKIVLIVGHSKFFRHMLGNACSVQKFSNCDIWEFERHNSSWNQIGKRCESALAHRENDYSPEAKIT